VLSVAEVFVKRGDTAAKIVLVRGFTLVEIMLVVSIIGLLAILAIPAVRKARMRAQDSAFVNDIRSVANNAFEQYAIEKGDYPPDAAPGVMPPEIVTYLPKRFVWTAKTPIGGQWDWDRAAGRGDTIHGVYAGLSVYQPSRTTPQMRDVDQLMDDGSLLTGRFRSRTDGYIYVLED